jgi:4'-phosphopantetheinyl transferase
MTRIFVYYARESAFTPEAMARDEFLLQADESHRAKRFHFEHDRRVYVAAHALLRRSLSKHAPVDPRAWRFAAREHGRPEIAEPVRSPRLRFSLSHTRGIAACAIAHEVDVGFDVEDVAREVPLEVAERFAEDERATLRSLSTGDREGRFFAFWTLKEAYMKARGLGLAIGLDQVAFRVSPAEIRVSFGADCPDDAAAWRFESWLIEGAHHAAIAVATSDDLEIHVSSG